MKTKILLSMGCLLVHFALRAKPEDYRASFNTPAEAEALIARLWHPADSDITQLWPEGKIPLKANDRPLKYLHHELNQSNVVVTDVSDPFFVFYRAKESGPRPVVVVLPGGGYTMLGLNKEGTEIAEWLNTLGFSAAVLVYRAPDQREAALCDLQRTIGLLRRDAEKYGIDSGRVGVIGFSAGANLAVAAATNWRTRAYARVDAADDLSCRPDFQMPIYPWDLLTRNDPSTPRKGWTDMKIRREYPVDAETPPAFIVQALDDFCRIETAVAYDFALRQAGVDSTAKIYPNGGHGYGRRRLGSAADVWSYEAAAWLERFARPSRKVLFLGDSITDPSHVGCTKNYWGYLGDRFGFNPFVYGISGHQISHIPGQADSFAAEHPGIQPDVVFVFAGTNDFNSNTPLGEWFDYAVRKVSRNGQEMALKQRRHKVDSATVRGRINAAILHLRGKFPLARIVLLTPIHRGYAKFCDYNEQPDETFANQIGLFIDDYADAIKEAGNIWSVKVVDLNAVADIYPNARAHDAFVSRIDTDRLHPSTEGHRRLAEAIAREIGDLLK
ncbi:MAG: GDSL-type esterase/lipase family protein [Kiritimatiellia bacterium]